MKIESSFYVIRSECGYWHYNTTGALVTCWGDPLTAERFDSPNEARMFLNMTMKARNNIDRRGGGTPPRIAKVSFTVTPLKRRGVGDD